MASEQIVDFLAEITLLEFDQGGRHSPPEFGYRPTMHVDGKGYYSCVLVRFDQSESNVFPVDEPFVCSVRTTEEARISLDIDSFPNFLLTEGKRIIGNGVVIEIR